MRHLGATDAVRHSMCAASALTLTRTPLLYISSAGSAGIVGHGWFPAWHACMALWLGMPTAADLWLLHPLCWWCVAHVTVVCWLAWQVASLRACDSVPHQLRCTTSCHCKAPRQPFLFGKAMCCVNAVPAWPLPACSWTCGLADGAAAALCRP